MRPFVDEEPETAELSDDLVAAEAGVPEEVVRAVRRGIPYYKVEQYADALGRFFRVDRMQIIARYDEARQEAWRNLLVGRVYWESTDDEG